MLNIWPTAGLAVHIRDTGLTYPPPHPTSPLPLNADFSQAAVEKCLDDNLRTADIYAEGKGQTLLGCKAMGEAVAKAVEELAKKPAMA